MTHKAFNARLDEMLEMIERALAAIEQGGGQPELRSLQKLLQELLINCMRLLERNPGIEAAASDLYAAASVLVADSCLGAQPLARKLRLFREARLRVPAQRARHQDRVATPRVAALRLTRPTVSHIRGEGRPDCVSQGGHNDIALPPLRTRSTSRWSNWPRRTLGSRRGGELLACSGQLSLSISELLAYRLKSSLQLCQLGCLR
jgi:hypothetical protein